MDLIIELTRRCNMNCCHCLRGCQQNKDIDDKTIENIMISFTNESFPNITLTGGEPSLVPEKILTTIKYAKQYNVEFENFYIATNALEVSDLFIKSVTELYLYCYDNEFSMLHISNDEYHSYAWEENCKKLELFKFTSKKFEDGDDYTLINEGRAPDNYSPDRLREIGLYKIDEEDEEPDYLYINALGNILLSCDLSFDTQDLEQLIIGNINEEFELEEGIQKYNNMLEQTGFKTVQNIKESEYELT